MLSNYMWALGNIMKYGGSGDELGEAVCDTPLTYDNNPWEGWQISWGCSSP